MKPVEYVPQIFIPLQRCIDVPTGWQGPSIILADILNRFHVKREFALEFGVEFGYSTVALSNFFENVVGVDHFKGDEHAGYKPSNHYEDTAKVLSPFHNIGLIPWSYQDFISHFDVTADFIHIDIVHDFEHTYECGLWAIKHAPVVIFHDTRSFPEVALACEAISEATKCYFYNWPEPLGCNGLGILSTRELEA